MAEVIAVKEAVFLAVIVSFDTYLAAAAYCNSGIRIPVLSAAVINLISGAVLWLSLSFSGILREYVSAGFFHILSVAILTFIGAMTIFKSLVRRLSRRLSERGELSLKMGKSPIVLKLYLDDTAADFDNSKVLSVYEAAALAAASSVDSAAVGISCGYSGLMPAVISVLAVICGFAAIILGGITGKLAAIKDHDYSWIGGILLILFAIFCNR